MTIRRALAAFILLALSSSTIAQQKPTVKAFVGFTLLDGTDGPAIENAAMMVEAGRITAVGPLTSMIIPISAVRVPLPGKIVIPGLINTHGHVNDAARDLRVYAAYGVTTVFSLGGEQPPVFAARDGSNSTGLSRSRVFVAGAVPNPASPEEARSLVADLAAQKVDIVKIRVDDNLGTAQKMAPEVYKAVIDEAHRLGLRVAVHLFYLQDAKALLEAGADFIAHSVRDLPVDDELIGLFKTKNVCLTPTLMREVSTFVYEGTPAFLSDPLFLTYADPKIVASLKEPERQADVRNSASAQRYKTALDVAGANLTRLFEGGVPITMGTDTGPTGRFQGYFELMELELMVKAGLTTRQALASATRLAAECMKVDREIGTLENGKWADFIALDGDPLVDIANTRKISSVWIAGNRVAR